MQDERLQAALNRFLDSFEHVFHDDWEHTKGCLRNPSSFACEESFLYPATDDEGNNWCSRKCLLSSYRELVSLMMKQAVRHPDLS